MLKRLLIHKSEVEEFHSTASAPLSLVQNLLFNFWWILLYAILCFMIYEQGTFYFQQEEKRLQTRLGQLQQMRDRAIVLQDRFKMEINSQSDPDWIELVLMKGLGVVPEGQTKIYFPKKH